MEDLMELARSMGIPEPDAIPWGPGRLKIRLEALDRRNVEGKLVLVTAMSPSPAGEGKTTVTIGLTDALCRMGIPAAAALRQPSQGPVFGRKGGATGSGKACLDGADEINLHFTGDFHAVTAAHNLIAAALDNHLYHGNALGFDFNRIIWHRILDVNDRALRHVVIGLGGHSGGHPREERFDITPASEIMAILALVSSRDELADRLGSMILGFTPEGLTIRAHDLNIEGGLTALLKDALLPNLVQTREGNPALVHTGPFANIAHGTSSLVATRLGMGLRSVVVQEAGFGADLGGEKFIDIFCRRAGVAPSVAVLVASLNGIRYQSGRPASERGPATAEDLRGGLDNIVHHGRALEGMGVPVVVALNEFDTDLPEDLVLVSELLRTAGMRVTSVRAHQAGSAGTIALAESLTEFLQGGQVPRLHPLYELDDPLAIKISRICQTMYGASGVEYMGRARSQLEECEAHGFGRAFICMAKTQYSLTDDPHRLGVPRAFPIHVREIHLLGGAGFVVPISGEVLTMPGLPRTPRYERMGVGPAGNIYTFP